MQTITHFFKHIYHTVRSYKVTTPSAIIIGALLLSVSHVFYGIIITTGNSNTQGGQVSFFNGRPLDETYLVTGNTKSDVIVLEYSDTECPFCAQLHPTIKKLEDDYKDKVGFVYRYFPLTQIHPNAFAEAQAIYCVGKTFGAEKQREYINEMFNYKLTNKNMTLPPRGKEDLVRSIGLDDKKITSCISGQESSTIVSNSIQEGIQAGVEGTPATFVLLRTKDTYEVIALIDGARPYEYFKSVLDQALAR